MRRTPSAVHAVNLLPKGWPEITPTNQYYHWPDQKWAEKVYKQGFYYGIWLSVKDRLIYFEEGILPGIIPVHQLAQTYSSYVKEKLKLCSACGGSIGHVIEEVTGKKFCPILFHDLVRPKWRVGDIV